MRFEWDAKKAAANLKKHKISFELALTVFDDPMHLSVPEPDAVENRWATIGLVSNQQALIVIHCDVVRHFGEEVIRIISARKATRKEKQQYEEGI